MIPSVLARQMRQGVEDFLRTTFPVSTPFFHGILDRLLIEKNGVFKGPYLSLQLPFRQSENGTDFFSELPLGFTPFFHQEQAFRRLSPPHPQSTIVATGTGSGKTECFLYPILDHCLQHRGEPGIKAVIIYPMNALATDQAGRLAKIIWNNPKLKGYVTAGLYVGQNESEPRMIMGSNNVITNKESQRLKPPDILLTNYKMLDYLLVRIKDYPLWQHNTPQTLRFLVVDELHTFDGAQGTDLACLLRRLKARFKTPKNYLCCIGTSATLGSESEQDKLLDYAQKAFGESFDEKAVINESRLSAGEFLEKSLISSIDIVPPDQAEELDPEFYEGYKDYVCGQYRLWYGESIIDFENDAWRIDLGKRLKEHYFFQNLIKILGGKTCSYNNLISESEKRTHGLKNADPQYKENLLNSMLALICEARIRASESPKESAEGETEGKPTLPFLNVRLQFWLRELRRMVGEIKKSPCLQFADDLNMEQRKIHLPIIHCRECGSMGWGGIKRKHDSAVNSDLQSFYISFFKNDPNVVFLFPDNSDIDEHGLDGEDYHLCGTCLNLTQKTSPDKCPFCDRKELIRVFVPNSRVKRINRMTGSHDCPYCNAFNSLTIIGSRAASLTSVLIAQLYSSNYNDDKKLLTFSDSVQDAAHRAGFFGARTYRFNFRSALQQFMQAEGNNLSLANLTEAFIRYWSAHMDKNTYIASFIAPNMTCFRDYEYLKQCGSLPEGSRLRQKINKRIEWEIYSEYGFRARIGRTLEKTSCSVAHLKPELLNKVTEKVLEVLQNEIGGMRNLDELALKRFIVGLIVHLKNQGGVLHPVLKGYLHSYGNTYLITQQRIHWMPGFGSHTRAPMFLTTRANTRFDQLFSKHKTRRTWYQGWAEKCFFPVYPLVRSIVGPLYEIVLKSLIQEEVLEKHSVQGDLVWGMKPDALVVSSNVLQFFCSKCRHNVSVEATEKDYWNSSPCLRFHCNGEYKERRVDKDYYGKLYASGDIQRIFAEEHTGLLNREERENIEGRFKAEDRKPWDPNLLSCTPTLEMGIDIGDLSSLILCSVPPAQSNYQQRIGRAGRRDGNALDLTVANARPHDLYFFAEPEEMIDGKVDTPGIFLDASAVLERQLMAFCFDRWVESGIDKTALPERFGRVLNNLEPVDKQKFPHNLLHSIKCNQESLLNDFTEMFAKTLSEDSLNHLQIFMEGDQNLKGSLLYRIMENLHEKLREQESLRKKVRTLRNIIRRKENSHSRDKNYEDEMNELKREARALQDIIKRMNDRNTLNFFTDAGLLPNYAFPEAGVLLRSIIYRKKEKIQEEGSNYDIKIYEYERPAVSAIGELAPANYFYAGGRKVQIDQVDMALSEVEIWRFCKECSHMELLAKEEEKSSCPCCGNTLWSDEGQKRPMLRMRQVFATTSDSRSRIEDDSDEREPTFYSKQTLVDFDQRNIKDAYQVVSEEMPFGFEFLSKATFREVNFGEKGEIGEKMTISGVEMPRKGFTICKFCGKIQDKKGKIRHALICTARDQDSDKNLADCVYLYREFSSEAIRILLPILTFSGHEGKLHSFIAALQLGLKRMFGGDINHLQTTEHEEPVADTVYRKKYLVLFDKVPGGTGYLKQLMRSEEPLLDVLELALDALRACSCNQDPEKDGCYRCLFAYRSSYNMEDTSRETAKKLLSDILKYRDQLKKTENLKKVHVNVLFDSELEERFIGALKHKQKEDLPIIVKNELVNGKPGYFLKVGEIAYNIELQVNLGPDNKVSIPSKADFVLRPARTQSSIKPIVVFADGYKYHKDRIGLDMAQRMAIAQSGLYHVWSLTWNDVKNPNEPQKNYFKNYLDPGETPNGSNFNELLEGFSLGGFRKIYSLNSFELFLEFLKNPNEKMWQLYAFVHGLINLDPRRFVMEDALIEWSHKLDNHVQDEFAEILKKNNNPCLYGLYEPQEIENEMWLRLFIKIEQTAIEERNAAKMQVACFLDDKSEYRDKEEFNAIWNGYLRLYNLFQFLPYACFVTRGGLTEYAYESIRFEDLTTSEEKDKKTKSDVWKAVHAFTDPEIHDLLVMLEKNKWPAPEAGYELTSNDEEIVATAELGWLDLKIAFLRDDENEYLKVFKEFGWRVFLLKDVLADPESYISMI